MTKFFSVSVGEGGWWWGGIVSVKACGGVVGRGGSPGVMTVASAWEGVDDLNVDVLNHVVDGHGSPGNDHAPS